jgi:hypothetical protein
MSVKLGIAEKAVHALVGDGNSQPLRASQPIGVGVDTDHRCDLEILGGAQNLDHQVGADIAGSDDGHFGFRHDRSLRENVADTSPSGAISARIRVPGGVATIGPRAPDRMIWPGPQRVSERCGGARQPRQRVEWVTKGTRSLILQKPGCH